MKPRNSTLVLTDGAFDHASSRIRAVLYFSLFIEKLNLKIFWAPRIPGKKPGITYKFLFFPALKRFYALKIVFFILFRKFKVVYIQRYFVHSWLLSILKWKGSAIIYDFDDAIYIDKPGQSLNYNKVKRILEVADSIIVSSGELFDFCLQEGYSNVRIITTPIDSERFTMKIHSDAAPVVIGWIGSPSTTRYLYMLQNVFQNLSKGFGVKFLFVGADPKFKFKDIACDIIPWNYLEEPDVLSKMDIGIMPLIDEPFARGKGGYKLFQYMSCGIPVVASPVGINKEIVIHGENGFLAQDIDEWQKYLDLLIHDYSLRKNMGEKGKADVNSKYSRRSCFILLKPIIEQYL